MKLITAIIRPEKLGELIEVVIDNKAHGLTVTEGRGFGRPLGLSFRDRASDPASPQLVDEVVLHQRVHELEAGVDDDVPAYLLLQLRDLVRHVAVPDRRVVPVEVDRKSTA